MFKEALEYIVHLKTPHFHKDAEDREFSDRGLTPVNVSLIAPATLTTLAGFCDLASIDFEALQPAEVIAQVVSHKSVTLFAKESDEWSRRTVFIKSDLPDLAGFPFGTFLDHETFVIGLQANFTASEDRDYLLHLASNLTSERVRVSEDDGISQSVNLRAGIVLKTGETAVKTRVLLAPYRTFREVEQPASEFVFRLRDGDEEDEPPTLALFEADGGKWKLDAMINIGHFLRDKLDNAVPVII